MTAAINIPPPGELQQCPTCGPLWAEAVRDLDELASEQADATDALLVLTDKRLFQAEWQHYGHTSECTGHKGEGECWTFAIGLSVEYGRVNWIHGALPLPVIREAARVLRGDIRIQDAEGYAG